jgi:Fe-S-cluster containining protein
MAAHVCARCPKVVGRSCCQTEAEERLATLTRADVARVASHTGLSPARFSEGEWLTHEEAHAYEARRPLWAGYFRRSTERLTLRRQGGACVFLGPGGCRLPAEVRPLACRLFPFEVWPDGTVGVGVERRGEVGPAPAGEESPCLAVEEADSLEGLLGAFGLTPEEVRALATTLRAEVRQHALGRGCP